MGERERVREALRLLADQARDRVDRNPHGHLLAGGRPSLELRVSIPLAPHEGHLDDATRAVSEALDRGVEELLAHAVVFRPGHVLCLRCQRADCEHSAPVESRHVFAGYGPTGTPRWVDFVQLLLDRHDARVGELYEEDRHPLLTTVLTEDDLARELLPSFRDAQRDYRIHGQVAAGWYRIPDPSGRPVSLAISAQVVSTRPRGARRRFGLNVLAAGPGGELLADLYERVGAIPWIPAVRWGQAILGRVASEGRGKVSEEVVARRVDGLLGGLARRLSRVQRARDRRTRHAEERHGGGDRPTRMAMLDLSRADDDAILVDTRRHTVVVLGDRGRAHVFNEDGKLVTSVRYPPQTIARRRETGLWRPATREEAAALRSRVAP